MIDAMLHILSKDPGEAEDAVGLVCWLLGPELLKKISAGFREIGDDKML